MFDRHGAAFRKPTSSVPQFLLRKLSSGVATPVQNCCHENADAGEATNSNAVAAIIVVSFTSSSIGLDRDLTLERQVSGQSDWSGLAPMGTAFYASAT
ncbi:hypothetical protein C7G41_30340 [Bradyrhizobium sp. MOS002]|nr:hypothetical protein C7G41_30340 [Bradyrhizobium sp. MOS002]